MKRIHQIHFDGNTLFTKLADLALALGHSPLQKEAGAWTIDLDVHWRIAVNPNKTTIKIISDESFMGVDLSPISCAVWFNGWLAALFNPFGGTFAAGEIANYRTFIIVIDAAIKKAKQPKPPNTPQPWRYTGQLHSEEGV